MIAPAPCPCCYGDGFIERPCRANTFNDQPIYQNLKVRRLHKRQQQYQVIMAILGLDELEGAA